MPLPGSVGLRTHEAGFKAFARFPHSYRDHSYVATDRFLGKHEMHLAVPKGPVWTRQSAPKRN